MNDEPTYDEKEGLKILKKAAELQASQPLPTNAQRLTIEDLELDIDIAIPRDDDLTGQGSRTRVEVNQLLVRAGAGVAA